MPKLSDHGQGIALLRAAANDLAKTDIESAHRELLRAMESLLQDFRTVHDVPGCRYFNRGKEHWALMPTERVDLFLTQHEMVEINRPQFLGRKSLHFDLDEL